MRGPKPPAVELTDDLRGALETFVRRHTTPQQLALRARIVLAAAAGANNAAIARDLHVSLDMVRCWRARWRATSDDQAVADRLRDAPRPGAPVRIQAEQVTQILALACTVPEDASRPISHWTARELADEIKKRGIVDRISGRHAARLLKRGPSNRI